MAMAMAFVLLLFVLAAPSVHSLQYGVTWNLGINYNAWAAGKTFTVGDTLGKLFYLGTGSMSLAKYFLVVTRHF